MAITTVIPGNLGRDAEFKTTQSGQEFCSFPVAASSGYGDNKQTIWVDVTRWGKGAEGIARILRKGSTVTVVGELSMREHNGKTYLQCRADRVEIQGTPPGDGRGERKASYGDGSQGAPADNGGWTGQAPSGDLDSDIPFFRSDGIR